MNYFWITIESYENKNRNCNIMGDNIKDENAEKVLFNFIISWKVGQYSSTIHIFY